VARAQLIIAAVVVEGRSKSAVAGDYDVSRYWVQQLVQRYEREGPAAYQPRSRRPHSNPRTVDGEIEELIVRLRKELSKEGWTPARRRSLRTWPGWTRPNAAAGWCPRSRRSGGSCPAADSSPRSRKNGRGGAWAQGTEGALLSGSR
jgi:transposase-like protein